MTRTWSQLTADIQAVVVGLRWGDFCIVEYDIERLGDEAPYAQAACEPGGWYAEVASDYYIPHWLQNEDWLLQHGWHRPSPEANWQHHADAGDVAGLLVEGLQWGRSCLLVDLFTIRVGRFTAPPDGGEPVRRHLRTAA